METTSLTLGLIILLPLFFLGAYYFFISLKIKNKNNKIIKDNSNYSVCLLTTKNLLKLASSNINEQFTDIDQKLVDVIEKGILLNSDIYTNKLKNITENSTYTTEDTSTSEGLSKNNHNYFNRMVLIPFTIIYAFFITFNLFIYINDQPKSVFSNFILIIFAGVSSFLFLSLAYFLYIKIFLVYQSALSRQFRLSINMKIQSDKLNAFIEVIHEYIDTAELFKSNIKNSKIQGITSNLESIKKSKEQLLYINEILKNDNYRTDLNEIVHKVLKICEDETEDLGIKIEATSEHPITIDISETSLFFILSVIINESMKNSTRDSLIIIEARKEKNKVIISIVDEGDKISSLVKNSVDNNIQSLDLNNVKPSTNGLSLYVVKTILGRYGGELVLSSNFYGNNVQIVLPIKG